MESIKATASKLENDAKQIEERYQREVKMWEKQEELRNFALNQQKEIEQLKEKSRLQEASQSAPSFNRPEERIVNKRQLTEQMYNNNRVVNNSYTSAPTNTYTQAGQYLETLQAKASAMLSNEFDKEDDSSLFKREYLKASLKMVDKYERTDIPLERIIQNTEFVANIFDRCKHSDPSQMTFKDMGYSKDKFDMITEEDYKQRNRNR